MPEIADIEAAAQRLSGVTRRTPLLSAPLLDRAAGRRIFVKAECLQITGSFKLRGAWSAISAMPDDLRKRGVVAFSSGNHAQGVAYAAARHGIEAVIIMPADAPATKIDNTRAYGAEVVFYDRYNEDRDVIGESLQRERGLQLVRPYDDPQVIAGQGTIGLEIAEQALEAGISGCDVLVPCGGGGLSSGIATALAARAPGMRVRTCEPAGFDDAARSLAAGSVVSNEPGKQTICDAIVTPRPGKLTFPILHSLCGPGLSVRDDEVRAAMALAYAHLKLVIEPGGAVALAAALFRKDQLPADDVIVVASGGNVDTGIFASAIAQAA